MVDQSHFLRQRLFSVSLCIGIALLNVSAWSAKPEPETEWKPPKLPEAVTIKPEGGVLEISSIDRTTRPEIEQAAAQIDSILQAYWNENKAKSGKKTTDHEFVRRAYLELAGRIPTIDEARTFAMRLVGKNVDSSLMTFSRAPGMSVTFTTTGQISFG